MEINKKSPAVGDNPDYPVVHARKRRLTVLVKARTAELEKELAKRKLAEEELRNSKALVDAVVENVRS